VNGLPPDPVLIRALMCIYGHPDFKTVEAVCLFLQWGADLSVTPDRSIARGNKLLRTLRNKVRR
jgi:hypothetical protein